MKNIIKILAALVFLLAIAYAVIINIPQADVKSKDVEITIEADVLYQDYNTDESAADNKYLGKVVQISGVIDELTTDEEGAPVVLLKNAEGEIIAIATLEQDQKEALSKYDIGQNITIKAQCNGFLMEVALNKGIIIE